MNANFIQIFVNVKFLMNLWIKVTVLLNAFYEKLTFYLKLALKRKNFMYQRDMTNYLFCNEIKKIFQ